MAAKDFSRFILVHSTYFKYEAHPRVQGDRVRINSCKYLIPIMCIDTITAFYEQRIRRGLFHDDPLDSTDYFIITNGLEQKKMQRIVAAVCMGVSYFQFGTLYKDQKTWSLEKIHRTLLESVEELKQKEYVEWKGDIKTLHEWAEHIDITVVAFRRRLKLYGVCDVLFMSKEEFKSTSDKAKKIKPFDSDNIGTPEWRALSGESPMLSSGAQTTRRRSEPLEIPWENATSLIAAMIEDAIENINEATRDEEYFYSSVRFLTNQSGYLKWLLDACPKCNSMYIVNYLYKEYSHYLSDVALCSAAYSTNHVYQATI